jgi:peptidoglycan/xylan/chitin deacetylase (PgdA/CDA1 family)
MLMRKGIPAAVFLVTDLIGTSKPQTHDKLHGLLRLALRRWLRPAESIRRRFEALGMGDTRHLSLPDSTDPFVWTRLLLTSLSARSLDRLIADLDEDLGQVPEPSAGAMPLSWDMVAEMHRAGVTIGSHTSSHALLTAESRPRVFEEVSESRRQLEQRLGHPVVHFAYPDGRFNRTAVNAVRLAGYQFGYTTCEHRDSRQPLLTIPRRVLWEHSAVDMNGRFVPEILRCQERGWLLGRRPCSWQSHA